MNAPPLIELRDVHVWYRRGVPGEVHALHGVSLAVQPGARMGVMGRSGSGKSTLICVIAGLQTPDVGECVRRDTLPRGSSVVFQFPERQLFGETVFEDVAHGLGQGGVPRGEIASRVEQALADVGLPADAFASRLPFTLSGGEKRRVALAGALAQRRALVLLDEPTLGLDAEGTARLCTILDRMHASGIAYWIASHDADFLSRVCTELVVLDAGSVAFSGEPAAFWSDPHAAERHDVHRPQAATFAADLQRLGARSLPACPAADELAAALLELATSRRGRT
jgi:energy-coupling factor transport system ATP-binding protein